jgi:hypothetical protein
MAASLPERNRELEKLFKDIGDKVELQLKEANARLKDYYKTEYDSAVRDCKAAITRGDTLTALFYQTKAKNLSDTLGLFQ